MQYQGARAGGENAGMAFEGLLIKQHKENDTLILSVIGDVLISNAGGLQRHLDEAIGSGAQTIVLDMSGVGYIDSFGVGVVVETQSKIDEHKVRFRVVLNPTLSRIFQKSHLDEYIEISVKGPPASQEQ